MNVIFVVSLEPIETRYTVDWYDHIPDMLSNFVSKHSLPFRVINIGGSGETISEEATDGAFLNFAETNIWKNAQSTFIAKLFRDKTVVPGDKFLFTDAWNPAIIQLRYMSSLTNIPVEIHSIWHAGSYDPRDFLGRKFDKSWSYNFERSLFFASDKNYFATEYHADLFRRQLDIRYEEYFIGKGFVVGFPFEYLKDRIKYDGRPKKDLLLFPHRLSEEKQPEIFRDLATSLPEYEFIFCQDRKLTKQEYYDLLLDSKIVFSANLQETLGISLYEGYLASAIPVIPNRLSYSEMYDPGLVYPSEWTSSAKAYVQHKYLMIKYIQGRMDRYDAISSIITKDSNQKKILDGYFSSEEMLTHIFP